jgi:hypothetical protein
MAFRSRARRGWATLRAEHGTLGQGLVAHALGTLAGSTARLTLAHRTSGPDHVPVAMTAVEVTGG